ncbi:Down syndrome cell adhesion molecule-like protein Dscam2 isoform X2 [Folsomia candida]|uniref:Down syndrome cell adhesion molecule-like protein Dscam2 isoform X2 n=1 Tax=Folsomia candida TaxID=158441 RepID=UPI001604A1F2|nr:Down syndrome cell adhesion molecule-like protein Dscam2 isoform X2 [Folsomia candida]
MKPLQQPCWIFRKLHSPIFFIFLLLRPQELEATPSSSSSPINFASSTGIFSEPQWHAPRFTEEPGDRIDFLNEHGAVIVCQADGYPMPSVIWLGGDNKLVSTISNFRTVLSNSTLLIHPFKPAAYRQDVHSTIYICKASNTVGTIRSRDIHVRAVIAQQWSVKIVASPAHLSPRAGPILLKCEVDLMGGGREFVQVTGWKRDQKFITQGSQRLYDGGDEDESSHWHVLPNGDLVIDSLLEEDFEAKVVCQTRHKITRQQIASPPFIITFSEMPNHARSDLNIVESFPVPIVIREGEPIVLNCYSSSPSFNSNANIRWEKLSGNSWVEISVGGGGGGTFHQHQLRQIGNSLVSEKSARKSVAGNYRCFRRGDSPNSKESVGEFEVRVSEPLSVSVTINQAKSPLESTTELTCTVSSSSHDSPSVIWLKDGNLITSGGRIRFFATNVLQINQIQQDDRGMWQCLVRARAEMESVQDSVRLEIADAPPRLIYGFNDQTLMPGPMVSLKCVFFGWPPPTMVKWTIDGWPVSSDDSRILIGNVTSHGHLITYLNISETRVEDGGNYQCSAQNRASGVISHSSRLNIYGPLWIRVVSPVVAISGEFFVLSCPISGWPRGFSSIVWEKDGQKLPSNPRHRVGTNGSLTITLVDKSDSGGYHCSILDSQGRTIRREIRVNVVVKVKVEPFAFQEALQEKMMTRLVCGVSQGDLPITFVWFKDGVPQTTSRNNIEISTLDSFSTILRFSSLSELNSGTYTCLATNLVSQTHYSAKLLVQVAPRWVKEPADINVTRGDGGQLACSGFSIPKPKITWLKSTGDDKDLNWRSVETIWPSAAAKAISLENGSLIFYAVEEVHEGQYMCTISNGIGSGLSKIIQLHVHVPPYFVGGESQSISLTQGKTHEITCEVCSSSPSYVTWSKGTNVFFNVPANRIHTVVLMEGRRTKSTLVMKDIRSDDTGLYKCTASNSLGKVARSYRVMVEEQPGPPQRLRLAEESQRNGPEATRVVLEWDLPSEYSSSKESRLSGEEPPRPFRGKEGTTTTVAVLPPPILIYVLEFSLTREKAAENTRFSRHMEVPGGGNTRATVDNLSPAAEYAFRVHAVNRAGAGPASDYFLVRTANIPPTVSPSNVHGIAVSSRSLLVSWSLIPVDMTFGRIVAYHVVLGLNADSSHGNSGNSATILVPSATSYRNFHNNATVNEQNCCETLIHGLLPFSHYEIKVRGLNIAGAGPLSPPFSVRTSEEAPQLPPRNPQCLALTSHSIQLSWLHPAQSNGPINSYKVLFYPLEFNAQNNRGFGGEMHRTTGLTAVIGGLSPNTNYSFHISPINIAGEGSQSLSVFCKTSEDVPSSPSNLIGFPSTETSVYLSWLQTKPTSHSTIYFRVIDKMSDSYVKRTVPGNVDYHEENDLDLSRFKYVFWVTSSSHMGESQPSKQLIFSPPPLVETRLVGQSRSIEIREGNPLILPCRILDLPMGPSSEHFVSWSLDGKRVGFDGNNVYIKPGQTDLMFISTRKSDQGNYTCSYTQMKNGSKNGNKKSKTSKKVISGMDLQPQKQQLTYTLRVKASPCAPTPSYKILDRDILVMWAVDGETSSSCDPPMGFILYFRALGSILDWKKIIFQPGARNYTLKATCGSILNMYMVGFNEVGMSVDTHLMSVVVSHSIAPFPHPLELLVANITSVLLNLYPLNANITFCPVEKFSVALKEWRSSEWLPGKDVKIQFRNEYTIDGLKPKTPYEITITTFGYSTSRSTTLTFTTLTLFGDNPSLDVLSKHKVTSEYSPLYNNLTLILPTVLSIVAILASSIAIIIYCKTRGRQPPTLETNCVIKQPNDVNYGYLQQQRKNLSAEEQFYSGLPCPTPGLDDISPYATFQISDPKKFHEETFSQEIVVAKFHPATKFPRGSHDKWMDRDSRQMQDSEDSESENAQRYSVIPVQKSRLGNLYQINPPSQPPPLPYQSMGYQKNHHQIPIDNSDLENGDSSSSSSAGDPSRTTMDRRTAKKDRNVNTNKKSAREMSKPHKMKESGSSTNLRRNKRRSTSSDYSIAIFDRLK